MKWQKAKAQLLEDPLVAFYYYFDGDIEYAWSSSADTIDIAM